MNTKELITELDYQHALSRLSEIFDAPVNSKEGDEAESLTKMIEDYENLHYPITSPDQI